MEIKVIEPRIREMQRLRVCAYCRVSTEEEEQENSLENQIQHYEENIKANPAYEFAGIYRDFGISGFKENRPGFQAMLQATRNHEVDLIITKSVSRFCRNTDTLLKAVMATPHNTIFRNRKASDLQKRPDALPKLLAGQNLIRPPDKVCELKSSLPKQT